MTQLVPENWLSSTQRAIGDYLKSHIDAYVKDNLNANVGLDVYDVIFDWPESDDIARFAELQKTVIHLVVDDIDSTRLGIGDNQPGQVDSYDANPVTPDTITYQEGMRHEINFDVGVWASDQSGGSTARLVVYEMLQSILGTELGRKDIQSATGGVEIKRFNGGRFITDRINDIRTYRIIDCELVTCVYSRKSDVPAVVVDQEPSVTQNMTDADGSPIS